MSTEINLEELYNNSVKILTDLIGFRTISGEDNNALIDYCLFRAFTKDSEFAGNAQRAGTHYQLFAVSVSGKAQIDALIKPDIQIMSTANG